MAISSIGIGSGMDLSGLIRDLVDAQRAPQDNRINLREADTQAKISAFGSLRGALSDIEKSLSDLAAPSRSVTSSDDKIVKATISGSNPAAGEFSIRVEALAQSHSVVTKPGLFEKASESIGSGTLLLEVLGGKNGVELDIPADSTLTDLRDAINKADIGVSANILNGSDGRPQLMLTARDTGAGKNIVITVNGDAKLQRLAMPRPPAEGEPPVVTNFVEGRPAQDARVVLNGAIVTSASNTLKDSIVGISIELLAPQKQDDQPVTLSVGGDSAGWTGAFNTFVTAYNGLVEQARQLTEINTQTREGSLLTGDSTVRDLRSRLASTLVTPGTATNGQQRTLASFGLTSSKTGMLTFDPATFNKQLEDLGAENITAALKEITDGMRQTLNGYTGSGGLFETRTNGFRENLKTLGQQREALAKRMFAVEERLVQQFTTMDKIVGQLQSTSNFLTAQFEQIANNMNYSRRK